MEKVQCSVSFKNTFYLQSGGLCMKQKEVRSKLSQYSHKVFGTVVMENSHTEEKLT